MRRTLWVAASTAACVTMLMLASCDSTDNDDDDNGDGTEVNVSLAEYSVTPDDATVASGEVTFVVTNDCDEGHEFMIVRTDLEPDALPTEADGTYEEDGAGTDVIDEIGFVAPGTTQSITVNLASGSYVLLCNFVMSVDGVPRAHYAMGMWAPFTVN